MRLLGISLWLALAALSVGQGRSSPKRMLWAWERPEHLSWLSPDDAGVAYLAATLTLDGHGVRVHRRAQPLELPVGLVPVAVVRIESRSPDLSEAQRQQCVEAIEGLLEGISTAGVQIDFDARRSERAFYSALLGDLRRTLPAALPLTMTALASWCVDDRWIDGLPVDGVVPMVFRMGRDQDTIRSYLATHRELPDPLCQRQVGWSTDEPRFELSGVHTQWLFSPQPWTATRWSRALQEGPP